MNFGRFFGESSVPVPACLDFSAGLCKIMQSIDYNQSTDDDCNPLLNYFMLYCPLTDSETHAVIMSCTHQDTVVHIVELVYWSV